MIYEVFMSNIEDIVLQTVAEVGEDQNQEMLKNPTSTTALFGHNLDSMGIVFLVAELEERIADEFDINISLADERAMSQKTSPFRSIKTLVKYVDMLIKEQQADV
jgi:acyl carrier protein